jgi:uncharacterized protein
VLGRMEESLRWLAIALLLSFSASLNAQSQPAATEPPPFNIKANYTKYEYLIPMRDGVKLFTSVYVPKDQSKPYPFLMERTPYDVAPYGVDEYRERLINNDFAKAGYIVVYQDVRGRNLSEGKFIDMTPHRVNKKSNADVDESTDMYDSAEWLLKNIPNHNGRIGLFGISYPGFYVSASIIDSHPAIKAASPQAPVTDLYMGDDSYHGGAFMLASNFGFYSSFKKQKNPLPKVAKWEPFDFNTKDGYEFYLKHGTLANLTALIDKPDYSMWRDTISNDTYNDYWKSRNIAAHLKNIKAAVLTVGGWYDLEDPQGPLTTYRAIDANNPGIYNGLVMGPWTHGGWMRNAGERIGMVSFASKTAEYFQQKIMLPFFERNLKPDAKNESTFAKAHVFETGTNVWRQFADWPPREARSRTLYFQANGKLSWSQPAATPTAFDEYTSDPAKPVPYIGYSALNVPQEYMVGDQRFAATRTDVLTYATDVLTEDVTIAGPISPRLFVSTSGTDGDWVVKLIDVYPAEMSDEKTDPPMRGSDVPPPRIQRAGYQQLVRGEPLRGKFRNSFEKPEPFTPNKVEAVNFTMPDVFHTFRRGHKIMVQVQSSWFPLIDRNPQVFMRIPDAKPEDFKAATQRVYRAPAQASGIAVQVLGR